MLVLSRKMGEGIAIGDDIAVTVVRINGSVVRLGISAPAGVAIAREELCANDAVESGPGNAPPRPPAEQPAA